MAKKNSKESWTPFIVFMLLFVGIIGSWFGYRYFRLGQGTATTVGTITSCGTSDKNNASIIFYEFSALDSVYSGVTKTRCSFCNCDGKLTCLGKKYPVTYAVKDPDVSGIDLNHPVEEEINNPVGKGENHTP